MTITKHDGFAIIPKRCDKCNRLFWLEEYDIYYREVGIQRYSLRQIECRECMANKYKLTVGIPYRKKERNEDEQRRQDQAGNNERN